MVGFGNPRFNSVSSKPSTGSNSSNKWLPASVANKLDSLSMLPKDRAGGLRFEVTIRDHLLLHTSIFCAAAAAPSIACIVALATRGTMSLSTTLCPDAGGNP